MHEWRREKRMEGQGKKQRWRRMNEGIKKAMTEWTNDWMNEQMNG